MPKGIKGFQKGHASYTGIHESHHMWKGEAVGNKGLHHWVRQHLEPPAICELCKDKPPKELANKTGIYNRDFENWFYLCIPCHRRYDGNLPPGSKPIPQDRICDLCGSSKSFLNSKGVPNWFRHDNSFWCQSCHFKAIRRISHPN